MIFDPERRWQERGACRGHPPEVFFPEVGTGQPSRPGTAEARTLWEAAKAICRGCPVLSECRRDTLGEEYGIWGGLDQHERYLIRVRLPRMAKHWPADERRGWGRIISRYRAEPAAFTWTEIRRLTGISRSLGEQLTTEYEEHLAAAEARRAALAAPILHLPEPAQSEAADGPSFPDSRGRLDAWVRHNGVIGDAMYQGETRDGVWLLMNVRVPRGRARKWVKRADVQFHDLKPPFYMEYKERPDRDRRKPAA
ncbi:hypothetical protein ACZ90_00200 [Streptomyces albus subsp. albus]|nr:hypothetical protein ACZ90_00200 [Streptomyces albus subsp. albus]